MYNRTTDGSSDNEAVKIVTAIKPFAKKWFDEWGRSCIRCKKMTVTTAPSNNVIGVTDAFSDTEIFIPYMSILEDAEVGDTVWCKWNFDNMQTLYAESKVGDMDNGGTVQPESFKTLWTGSWSSGKITVKNIADYPMFMVRMDGQGTTILAMLGRGNLVAAPTYFRGIGGFNSSASTESTYYINATLSGDTLTMVDCHAVTQAGTRVAQTVIEIIGIKGFFESSGGGGTSILPYDFNPQMDGTASAGGSSNYSRGDHVHPKDTSKADVDSPTFTGTPAAPTAASGTNTTQIATTAFVQTEIATIDAVPSGGSTGQVLTKTSSGYAWQSLPLFNGSITIQ